MPERDAVSLASGLSASARRATPLTERGYLGGLEQDYLQVLRQVLPCLSPGGVEPRLLVLDSGPDRGAVLRAVPSVGAAVTARVTEAGSKLDSPLRAEAAAQVLLRLRDEGQTAAPPFGHVPAWCNLPALAAREYLVGRPILEQPSPPEELLQELMFATEDLDRNHIQAETLAGLRPVVLPLRALGSLRGAAVWFVSAADDQSPTLERQLHGELKNLAGLAYSHVVIDVLIAYLTWRLAGLGDACADDRRTIALESFQYLYPLNPLQGFVDPPKGSDELPGLRFCFPDELSRFFGLSELRWHSEATVPPEEMLSQAYHGLICRKLRDLVMPAMERLGPVQYSDLLGIFGHHVGTLFKASGAMTVWASADERSLGATQRVLDKLLPIWGVSQAISLHKKQGDRGWAEVLRDWVDPSWLDREDFHSHCLESLLTLALYVYAHGVAEEPFLPWQVRRDDETVARWLWYSAEGQVPQSTRTLDRAEVKNRTHRLATLPPLRDNPILFDKTLALTIGLFEMLSNLRKYPEARGEGREHRKDLEELPPAERVVELRAYHQDGAAHLDVHQPVVLPSSGELPISRSLERIRALEKNLLRGVAETGQLTRLGDTTSPHVVRASQRWTFRWAKLISEYRRVSDG